jgi:hypothetical protein
MIGMELGVDDDVVWIMMWTTLLVVQVTVVVPVVAGAVSRGPYSLHTVGPRVLQPASVVVEVVDVAVVDDAVDLNWVEPVELRGDHSMLYPPPWHHAVDTSRCESRICIIDVFLFPRGINDLVEFEVILKDIIIVVFREWVPPEGCLHGVRLRGSIRGSSRAFATVALCAVLATVFPHAALAVQSPIVSCGLNIDVAVPVAPTNSCPHNYCNKHRCYRPHFSFCSNGFLGFPIEM